MFEDSSVAKGFEIPIVIFFFKRIDKTIEIINRVKLVKPRKIYLISDGGRTPIEMDQVLKCREVIERQIDWECEIVKNYAVINKGVYDRIGEGSKWVFEREKYAIFLEDDNLPEVSFFEYAKDLLLKYEQNEQILWVCGTNYLGKYKTLEEPSYYLTQHVLPCGWASWSNKFTKYYDGKLATFGEKRNLIILKNRYISKRMYKQQLMLIKGEYKRIIKGLQPSSWDYQMDYSLKINNLYGIIPNYNQIKNIGVDEFSTHGGTSKNNPMTVRFTKMESYRMEIPLNHPQEPYVDQNLENQIAKVIIMPYWYIFGIKIAKIIRKLFKISDKVSISSIMFNIFKKK